MKSLNKTKLLSLFFLYFISFSLASQDPVITLATESYYSSKRSINSRDYDARNFRDVYPFDPNDYFVRAVEKFQSEFYKESLLDFDESIQLFPECAVCFYYRGINHIILDRLEKGKSDLIKAIDFDPRMVEAYNDLSIVYMEQGKRDSAKYFLQEGIRFYPNYALTYYNLGYVELVDRKLQKALKQFKKALDIDPCHSSSYSMMAAVYLSRNNFKKAEAILDKLLKCDEKPDEIYLWKALIKLFKRKKKAAIEMVTTAIELDQNNYIYYFARGSIYNYDKKYHLAIEDVLKAYTINPLNSEDYQGSFTYENKQEDYEYPLKYFAAKNFEWEKSLIENFEYSLCQLLDNNKEQAEKGLKKIIAEFDNQALAYYLMAILREGQWKKKEAISYFDAALAIDPGMIEAYERRGLLKQGERLFGAAIQDFNKMYALNPYSLKAIKLRANARMMAGDYMHALIDFNYFLKTDSTDIDLYYNKGLCSMQLGDFQLATQAFERVIRDKPKDTQAYYKMAQCKLELGDTLATFELCDSILSIKPCHVQVFNLRGTIHLNKQDYAKARKEFETAIVCSPVFFEGHLNRGITNMKMGKFQNALYDINKAVALDPNSGIAYFVRAQIKQKTQDTSACEDLEKAIRLNQQVSSDIQKEICPTGQDE